MLSIGLIGTIYCIVNVTVNQIVAVAFLLLALAGIYAHFLLNGMSTNIYGTINQRIKQYSLKKERIEI